MVNTDGLRCKRASHTKLAPSFGDRGAVRRRAKKLFDLFGVNAAIGLSL